MRLACMAKDAPISFRGQPELKAAEDNTRSLSSMIERLLTDAMKARGLLQ